ncbi:hypothetical protein C1645_837100 [Glomus cerebriforme]|uniref:Uncharacterized protein n=1 Tax=Glomus cerebriforme TaxID=658196 RepID=A0A397S7B9_9GLOM|nr:hypothetical protein C1645_837100 [Glomus cerebriforme]
MSKTMIIRKWTTEEFIEVLSFINNNFKTSSDSLSKSCKKAVEHLHLDRSHRSVYSKVTKSTRAVNDWMSNRVKNSDAIIWEDDRVFKLLEEICKRLMKNRFKFIEVSIGEQGLQQHDLYHCHHFLNENQQAENCSDTSSNSSVGSVGSVSSVIDKNEENLSDSDSTIDGEYENVDLYRQNEIQSTFLQSPSKIFSDRIREAEKARDICEVTGDKNNYNKIHQTIKQIQEYRDKVFDLFEEIDEIRSF